MLHGWGEIAAAEYLRDTYFQTVPIHVIQRIFPAFAGTAWGDPDVLLAGHWTGIFGTYPGTGTGSLTIESVHSSWERSLVTSTRAAPTE
eukprot:10401537-Prorocentrum_lima.AAC.1